MRVIQAQHVSRDIYWSVLRSICADIDQGRRKVQNCGLMHPVLVMALLNEHTRKNRLLTYSQILKEFKDFCGDTICFKCLKHFQVLMPRTIVQLSSVANLFGQEYEEKKRWYTRASETNGVWKRYVMTYERRERRSATEPHGARSFTLFTRRSPCHATLLRKTTGLDGSRNSSACTF